ncbi:hypothetical protein PSEUDO8Z_90196 [Pseudomonas sp. 8Z]|nr:hypothetical protein PSEUDO8Z_90196 [Pseudomonas sp. 8Z]
MLAGTGGLDGGVERQQVGLLGDALDHPGDLGNLPVGGLDARLLALLQAGGGFFIGDLTHRTGDIKQLALSITQAATTFTEPDLATGLVAHAVLHGVETVAAFVHHRGIEGLHHGLEIFGVDHLKVAVPAVGKLGIAVADQFAKLLGPADQVLRVVGVSTYHVHCPTAFGEGAFGQFPDLTLFFPVGALGSDVLILRMAGAQLIFEQGALLFGLCQALLQGGIFGGAAGRWGQLFAVLANALQFFPVMLQALQAAEQLRLLLQMGTFICRLAVAEQVFEPLIEFAGQVSGRIAEPHWPILLGR